MGELWASIWQNYAGHLVALVLVLSGVIEGLRILDSMSHALDDAGV